MIKACFRRLCLLVSFAAFFTGLFAQGQDVNHQWNGNSVASVANATDADMKTVYLYNVGTGKFLNAGSYWSTVAVGYTVGMGINIANSTTISGKYEMSGDTQTTEGQKIAFGRQMDTPGPDNPINYNNVYVDRGGTHNGHINGIIDWTFDETAPGSNTYTIHCFNDETTAGMGGEIYLQLVPNAGAATLTMAYPHSVDANDKNSQWKIVTRQDMKDAFKVTFASDEAPADATFLIEDQNFSRSHKAIAKWVMAGGLTSKPRLGNYSFYSDGGTYYVGMGSASSDNYQAKYAAYWIGNIRNIRQDDHANGTVTQTVRILKKGWYVLSCDGFYNADNGSDLESSFFARVAGASPGVSNVSAELNVFNGEFEYTVEELLKLYGNSDVDTESPYVKAGKLFNEGKYKNSLVVYVPADNTDLNIGVEVSGSTGDLDWTTFDNFQLKYCGDRDLVLDEAQTGVEYMNKQKEANVAKTLILKRTMKPGIWNSITLPVALTAGQFKTAFGEQAKLSTLKGQSTTISSRIDFESVDLSDDATVVMEPNKLYIMKPMREATVSTGSYTKTIETGYDLTVQAPYYVINNVTLGNDVPEGFKETSKPSTTSDEKLQFCGTQISHTTAYVPQYSYVLGANNGQWYYTQSVLPIKGFRCWIATGSEAQAKSMTFAIDGIVDTTTGIDVPHTTGNTTMTANRVYSLSGQLVRTNATSLEGLPKGIYIINNKKYIIK